MSKTWNYKSGDWLAICDVCSKKIKASKTKQRWDGFITCPSCWEPRHSQDFIKVRQDKITVPFLRPRPQDVFGGFDSNLNPVDVTYTGDTLTCTPMSRSGVAGIGIAGCAQGGRELNGIL